MVAELKRARTVRVSPLCRIHGFGSVFGKTIRDSRPALVVMAGMLSLLLLLFGKLFADAYPTTDARKQLVDLVAILPPVLKGVSYGSENPVRLDTLGGYISQDPGVLLKLIPGLWSILVLSATLAREAHGGSLEFLAAAPLTKRRIALEKLGAHMTAIAVAVAVVALVTWLTGTAFASLPGDAISPGAAIGYAVWLGLTGLMAGSIAFALAPFLGRVAAAGLAGAIMFGAYIVNGYQASFPAFSGVAKLTWFAWTAHHNPLAREYDWGSLALVALVTLVMFAVGVEAFVRRDLGLGPRSAVRTLALPDATLGLRGPVRRALGELLPAALAWGLGTGIYGLLIAASSRSFAEQLGQTPDVAARLHSLFPNYDITSTGGVQEATFMSFGFILTGLAAATFVGGWGSDETGGRLEMLLVSPLTRPRWAIAGGIGVYLGVTVVTLVTAAGIGIGAALAGGDVAMPVVGTLALGFYAVGLAGLGLAVGGLIGTVLAGPMVAGLAVATFLLDILVPAVKLPDWIHQLALTAHMGQPMVGKWDWVGIMASLVLALGGLALSGWGMGRRDVSR